MTDTRPTAPQLADLPRPAEIASVGLWGPSGCGKTQFALSICADLSYCPVVYADTDGGIQAVRHYEHADLLIHKPISSIKELIRLVGDIAAGRVCNRAGVVARTLVFDAASSLLGMELRRYEGKDPADQAKALAPQFTILFGHLRELATRHGVGLIEICHSKSVTEKVGEVAVRSEVPDLFPSIRRPWMAHLRHVWEINKARGARGPAFPIVSLRTEPRGKRNAPGFVEYMKTSNIAFAQWIALQAAEQGGAKCEEFAWDTGLLSPEEQPTLAMLLQVAADLQLEQGRAVAATPAAARALAALEAAAAVLPEPVAEDAAAAAA